jgi:hypothetical protein
MSMTFEVTEQQTCLPSSWLMSSLENIRPGIKPHFFSQKMDANDPEKKILSTAAKATKRLANVDFRPYA